MFAASDPHAPKTIVWARDEALRRGHDYTGTGHFVLAVLADEAGVVARSLKPLGAEWNDFLGSVEPVVGFGDGIETSLPLSPLAQEALRFAAVEAPQTGRDVAGPDHLLFGTLGVERCAAVRVLSDLGVSLAGVRREVSGTLGGDGCGAREA